MDATGSPLQSAAASRVSARQCVFCREEIRPGASVCPHCGSNLAPLQSLADQCAALEERLSALEQGFAAQQAASAGTIGTDIRNAAPPPLIAVRPVSVDLRWPHMVDNILLGLSALLAAHWIATTLPIGNRTIFRLVALAVALPFGFRFEVNTHSGTAGRVLAAFAFASLGTLAIGMLDLVVGNHYAPPALATDAVASLATIALSHFSGSSLARARNARQERRAVDEQLAAAVASGAGPRPHFAPAQIKSTAETVKALYDAAAPLVAAAAALWAAVGHVLF